MLKRKINSKLASWLPSASRKALLIKGARQVGKTTSVREFARAHYQHFVEVNFEKTPQARDAFSGALDARTIIMNLSAMGFGPFVKGQTLVFFDEIQSCPQARTAIKFLVEDGSLHYIESGSLLGINYKQVSSFPVGYEHQVEMFPLDFEEFLWASGISDELINTLRECFELRRPVPDFIHQQVMQRYNQYLIVGGMPEVVNAFLSNPDLGNVVSLQTDLLAGYRNDISKYAGRLQNQAKAVFDAIPEQLSKEKKRFVISSLQDGASQRQFGPPTQWLIDAGVALCSYNIRAFELPFPVQAQMNLYKLYLLDTGLLSAMIMNGVQQQVLQGNLDFNQGALTENFVAAQLRRNGRSLNYYDRKSRNELDFVYPDAGKIAVIEVKSGKDYKKHASLDSALQLYSSKIGRAMVLGKMNVEQAPSGITYLPLYMTMFL